MFNIKHFNWKFNRFVNCFVLFSTKTMSFFSCNSALDQCCSSYLKCPRRLNLFRTIYNILIPITINNFDMAFSCNMCSFRTNYIKFYNKHLYIHRCKRNSEFKCLWQACFKQFFITGWRGKSFVFCCRIF